MRRMLTCVAVCAVVGYLQPVLAQESRILTVRQVVSITNPGEKEPPPLTEESTRTEDGLEVVYEGEDGIVFKLSQAIITENHVVSASPRQEEGGEWSVALSLSGDATTRLASLTAHLACLRDQGDEIGSQLAIVVDRIVVAAHELEPEVECGTGITQGGLRVPVDDGPEARDLAARLGGSDEPEVEEDENPIVPIALLSLLAIAIGGVALRRYRSSRGGETR